MAKSIDDINPDHHCIMLRAFDPQYIQDAFNLPEDTIQHSAMKSQILNAMSDMQEKLMAEATQWCSDNFEEKYYMIVPPYGFIFWRSNDLLLFKMRFVSMI